MITIYQVTQFGKADVNPRPALGETLPRHADMLRYDNAFCDPNNFSRVIFPVFQHSKNGRTSGRITFARWDSFIMKLQQIGEESPLLCGKWITFKHGESKDLAIDYSILVPQTLEEFMAAGKYKLARMHR